jgi:hypothetical protein
MLNCWPGWDLEFIEQHAEPVTVFSNIHRIRAGAENLSRKTRAVYLFLDGDGEVYCILAAELYHHAVIIILF